MRADERTTITEAVLAEGKTSIRAWDESSSSVLILARALHAPWNEGTRVIARNVARAASLVRRVSTVSLTQEVFRGQADERLPVEHVYTHDSYGVIGDYVALPAIARSLRNILLASPVGVAHLIGLPLAVAPWLRRRGVRVVGHVTLAHQIYRGPAERLRAVAGWRLFDRWIDAYACTSEIVRKDLVEQGYKAEKLYIVPPPVDVECFSPVDRGRARRKLGWDLDTFVVAYVGTISPLRFPASEVLRALSLVTCDIQKIGLEVFAPVATHNYNVAWAEENVGRASNGDTLPVHIHLQDLAEDQKVEVYSAADVVLLPFGAAVAVEPPLTLLEAMACQAVVAVAPYANRSNVVRDRLNGLTYSSGEELAASLKYLHALGPQPLASLREEARGCILREYSFAATSLALENIWTRIER